MSFIIDLRKIWACRVAEYKEETRYYLNGLHLFSRDGSLVYECTDGHRLIRITDTEPQPEGFGLRDHIDVIIKAEMLDLLPRYQGTEILLDDDGDELERDVINPPLIEMDYGANVCTWRLNGKFTISGNVVDGKFPNTDAVFPKEVSCKALNFDFIKFNVNYMADFAKSLTLLEGIKTPGAEFRFGELVATNSDQANVAYLKRTVKDKFIWEGILMPLRDQENR